MRGRSVILSALLVCCSPLVGPAFASASVASINASRPSVAAPSDWVIPAAIPSAPAAAADAATVDLLSDIQTKYTAEGDLNYYNFAYQIQSPKGLDEAALQLNWDPALETLTLHHYRLIRNGKTLDLLGDGSKLSVIQREKNLENASLDGQLTASFQPTDVRVGDIVDIAYTRTRRDPALGGRSEALVGPADGATFSRLRFRLLWPDTKELRWHAFPGVLQPKLTHSAAGNELFVELNNVTTPLAPKAAPTRFQTVNAIEISEFADWGAVSEAMLPRYAAATRLGADSPVRAQAQRIAAQTSEPARRAELALALVQDQVRYLFLGMNDGGYVPAAADLTWSRRFGDCKAKAVLLTALLRELGIDAEPVLVNTERGDLVAHRLPAVGAFDHVIVRAKVAGRTYWMDGTRLGDTRLNLLRTPAYTVGLPIAQTTKALTTMTPEPLTEPSETVALALDATAGIDAPAPAKGEMRFRGTTGTDMRVKYEGLSATERDQQLRDLWRKQYDFVSPSSIKSAVDTVTGDYLVTMTGTAKMDWYADVGTRWYEMDGARLGWKFDTDREGAVNKDAPFQVDYPDYWESRETIKLPANGEGFKLQGDSLDKTVGGVYAFHRKVALDGNLVTMESSTRALAAELPASLAEQARSEIAALRTNGLYVRVPDNYMATAADLVALKDDKKALAEALMRRGAFHFDRQELTQSVADEDAAIAIDPKNAVAHSILALALAVQGDSKAPAAVDSALALDTKLTLAWRAKGIIALSQKRYADADAAFTRQLEIESKDENGLAGRASARLFSGRPKEALADADAALAINPDLDLHIVRAGALTDLNRIDEALVETDRAVEANPGNEAILYARAKFRVLGGKREAAIEDYDRLIKQGPKIEYYLGRSELWSPGEVAKRNADIESALRIDPHSAKALAFRASSAIDAKDFASAERDIGEITATDRDNDLAYELRLKLLQKQGKNRETLQLVESYVAKHPNDAVALNERCWTKATLDLDLDTALADCDASLKIKPNSPATLDSRGFTNLKLGATDAAIADYDAALKLAPRLPASLFGRAIARARKGDNSGARADLISARDLSPDIDARFADYGISLPPALGGPPPVEHGRSN